MAKKLAEVTPPTAETTALIDLARQTTQPFDVQGHPLLALHNRLSIVDLEEYLPAPLRIKARRNLTRPDSFIAYVNEFKAPTLRVFCTQAKQHEATADIVAELDSHLPGRPARIDHVAVFNLTPSLAWRAWAERHKQGLEQMDLANFLEERSADIAEPRAADILEIVQDLQANSGSQVNSVVRQGNVAKIAFTQEATARGSAGVELPKKLTLSIPVFDQWPLCSELDILLRYKVAAQRITFTLVRHDPEKVVRDCLMKIVDELNEKIGVPVLFGA